MNTWLISWEDDKPMDIVDEPPHVICDSNSCIEPQRLSENFGWWKGWYGKTREWKNTTVYMNVFYYPVEIKQNYIIVNYTVTMIFNNNITIDPSKEDIYFFIKIHGLLTSSVLRCSVEGFSCYWGGEPKLEIHSNITGKI